MPTIAEVRQKYPQYKDLSDQQLADGLHKKFYSDMPVDQFYSRIGFKSSAPQAPGLGEGGSYKTPADALAPGGMDKARGGGGFMQRRPGVSMSQLQNAVGAPGTRPKDKAQAYAQKVIPETSKFSEPVRRMEEEFGMGAPGQLQASVAAAGAPFMGVNPADAYNAARARQSELTKKNASPLATAGGVAGGVASMFTGAGELQAAEKGGLLPRMGAAAKEGVELGARYGAAAGAGGTQRVQDLPKNIAKGAAEGAAFGGVAGGAMPAVSKVGGALFDTVNAMSGDLFRGAAQSARARIAHALEADGWTPERLRNRINQLESSGVKWTLADIGGKNLDSLFSKAASTGGRAAQIADRSSAKVAENLGDAAVKDTKKLMLDQRPIAEIKESLTAKRKAAGEALYPKLKTIMVDPKDALGALRDLEGRKAFTKVIANYRANRDYDAVTELKELQNLVTTMETAVEKGEAKDFEAYLAQHKPKVSAAAIDKLQSGLEAVGRDIGKREGGAPGYTGLQNRAKDLSKVLDAVPEAKKARAEYKRISDTIDAFDQGGELLKGKDLSEYIKSFSALDGNPKARETFKLGARQALEDEIRTNPRGALKNIGKNGTTFDRMAAIFGPDEAMRYRRMAQTRVEQVENLERLGSKSLRPAAELGPLEAAKSLHNPATALAYSVQKNKGLMSPREAQGVASLGFGPGKQALRRVPKGKGGKGKAATGLTKGAARVIKSTEDNQ